MASTIKSPLERATKAQLIKVADAEGIDLDGTKTKADIVERFEGLKGKAKASAAKAVLAVVGKTNGKPKKETATEGNGRGASNRIKDAADQLLRRKANADGAHYKELALAMLKEGLIDIEDLKPWYEVAKVLASDAANPDSRFVRIEAGVYRLAK